MKTKNGERGVDSTLKKEERRYKEREKTLSVHVRFSSQIVNCPEISLSYINPKRRDISEVRNTPMMAEANDLYQ